MPSNTERADVADRAINAMGEAWIDQCDPEANLTDLLADLMHWAYVRGFDFDGCLRVARGHYACEAADELRIH